MTRRTNARIAGFTFLFYIATALPAMLLFNRATAAQGTRATLALIAQHTSDVRISIVLVLLGCFCALVLAVTLYGITRVEDHELAMIGLVCRVAEGVIGGIGLIWMMALLRLATAGGASTASDAATPDTLGGFLLNMQTGDISAIFFAAGSTIFAYLLLRGRMIPVALAWLGVFASIVALVLLPAQLVGLVSGLLVKLVWLPMLVFEPALALWLIIKGVREVSDTAGMAPASP